MKLQNRDVQLIFWINGFGFVDSKQVSIFLGVEQRVANKRLKKLVDGGLLKRHQIFHVQHHFFTVTPLGGKISGDDLPGLPKVRLNNYIHDNKLVDLSFVLINEFSATEILPERRIRHNRSMSGVGIEGRIPDCEIFLDGEKKPYAIELELSQKSKKRIHKIKREYQSHFSYKNVLYFATEPVRNFLIREFSEVGGGLDPLFIIHPLEKFISAEKQEETSIV